MDIENLFDRSVYENILDEVIYPKLYSPVKTLDAFLDENRHLLTLVGVFGAVSVYLGSVGQSISDSPEFANNYATFASLALLTLLSIVVIIKAVVEIYKQGVWEGFGVLIFVAFFAPLIPVITALLTTFPLFWAFYYLIGIYVLALTAGGLFAITPVAIGQKFDEWLTGERLIFSFIGNFSLLFTTSYYIYYLGDSVATYPSAVQIEQGLSFMQWSTLIGNFILAFTFVSSFLIFSAYISTYFIGIVKFLYVIFGNNPDNSQ